MIEDTNAKAIVAQLENDAFAIQDEVGNLTAVSKEVTRPSNL